MWSSELRVCGSGVTCRGLRIRCRGLGVICRGCMTHYVCRIDGVFAGSGRLDGAPGRARHAAHAHLCPHARFVGATRVACCQHPYVPTCSVRGWCVRGMLLAPICSVRSFSYHSHTSTTDGNAHTNTVPSPTASPVPYNTLAHLARTLQYFSPPRPYLTVPLTISPNLAQQPSGLSSFPTASHYACRYWIPFPTQYSSRKNVYAFPKEYNS